MPIAPSFATPNPTQTHQLPCSKHRPHVHLARNETATEGLAKLQVLGDYEQMDRMLDADGIDVAIDTRVNRTRMVKSGAAP